jgi:signal peptidase II
MMFFVCAGVVFVIDQVSKLLAQAHLRDALPKAILPNFLHLSYAQNKGGAFSLLANHGWILTLISVAAVVAILIWSFNIPRHEKLTRLSLALIFGGAVGNLLDRFRLGYVIDFIDAHWYNTYHWPTFNLADTSICIGIGLFIIATLLAHIRYKRERTADSSAPSAPERGQNPSLSPRGEL